MNLGHFKTVGLGAKRYIKNKLTIWWSTPFYIFRWLIITLLILSLIIFKDFWVSGLNTIWIEPIMSKLYGHELLVCALLLLVSCLYYIREFSFAEKINVCRLEFWIIYSFVYLICIICGSWDYSLIYGCSKVAAWTNLSLMPLVVEMALAIKCFCMKPRDKEPSLLEVEKTEGVDDTYGRAPICESTFGVLRTCFNEERSFSVAITGEWGSGKTTYMHALRAKYEEEGDVKSIIWYEPWKCDSPDLIIKSFFGSLRKEFRSYIPDMPSLIDEYVLTLLDSNDIKPLRLMFTAIKAAATINNSKSPYDRIRKELVETHHKVVVFIDDIDRLDAEEIKEVFRLVRNTADFPYIQFIVAYDREYVSQMLSKSGIKDTAKYLEKFFNVEIPLPKFEERQICEQLYRNVMHLFGDGIWPPKLTETAVKEMIYYRNPKQRGGADSGYIVPEILHTMRDVIRFSNALKLIWITYKDHAIQMEIDFRDLFYLEILRYGFDDMYMILRDKVLTALRIDRMANVYMPYVDKTHKKEIFSVISKNYSVDAIRIADVILDYLFTNKSTMHSLRNVRDYPTYFMFRLDKKILSDAEFMSLITLDELKLSAKVEEWSASKNEFEFMNVTSSLLSRIHTTYKPENGHQDDGALYKNLYCLLIRLCKVAPQNIKREVSLSIFSYVLSARFMSEEHFENTLELLENADWNKEMTSRLNELLMCILYRDNLKMGIEYSMSEKTKEIIKKFLRNSKHQEDISNALWQFIESFKKSSFAESKLVLGISDISDIQLEYFREVSDKLSENGISLFLKCWDYSKYGQSSRPILRPDALSIMRTAIEADPDKYFETFIHEGPGKDPGSLELFPAPYFDAIFGGYDEFERFLNSAKQSSAQNKVKKFWLVYKSREYQNIVASDHSQS